MENLDAPGCQNCALLSWVCEKASSSAQWAAHSNHSLRKLLQLLFYLGTANTTWTKPQSTVGWQDASESFSHHPSDRGEVAQRLSGAQGKDRQTPPRPVCLALLQLNTENIFYLLQKMAQGHVWAWVPSSVAARMASQVTGMHREPCVSVEVQTHGEPLPLVLLNMAESKTEHQNRPK